MYFQLCCGQCRVAMCWFWPKALASLAAMVKKTHVPLTYLNSPPERQLSKPTEPSARDMRHCEPYGKKP